MCSIKSTICNIMINICMCMCRPTSNIPLKIHGHNKTTTSQDTHTHKNNWNQWLSQPMQIYACIGEEQKSSAQRKRDRSIVRTSKPAWRSSAQLLGFVFGVVFALNIYTEKYTNTRVNNKQIYRRRTRYVCARVDLSTHIAVSSANTFMWSQYKRSIAFCANNSALKRRAQCVSANRKQKHMCVCVTRRNVRVRAWNT